MQTLMPTIRPTMLVPGIGGFTLGSRLWDVAGLRPSLDLQLATNKSLVDATTGAQLVTFTRASSGTYRDSQGIIQTASNDAPRFDHNPTTGESLGLLVEEARTNLCLHNRTLTDAAWAKTNITAAKDQVGVTGGSNTASSITATAANGTILQTITSASAARATSAYVKRITGTGTVEMTQDNGSTWTAVTVTSDWTRVTIPSATVTNPVVGFRLVTDADAIAVDFVQLESGAFSTSAIETTTAAATRSADVASISGSNFSSWYRQDEGTVFTDTANRETYPGANVFPYIMQIDDGTNNNRVSYDNSVLSNGYRYNLPCHSGGVSQGELNQSGFASGAARWASAFRTNDFALAINLSPSVVSTRTSGTLPSVMTQLRIGAGFGKQFTGTFRRITYWPARLPNSTLQRITQ